MVRSMLARNRPIFPLLPLLLLAAAVLVSCSGGPTPPAGDAPADTPPGAEDPAPPDNAAQGSPTASASTPRTSPEEPGPGRETPEDGTPSGPAPGVTSRDVPGTEPAATPSYMDEATGEFPDAPDRDLLRLAAQLSPDGNGIPPERGPVNPGPLDLSAGSEETFWMVDFRQMEVYQEEFDLRLVTPGAYWYVQKGQSLDQNAMEQAAQVFEEEIYPSVTGAFGQEWKPGIDNDPRINIIHASLRGVGGYFSSMDEHPQSVLPFSNQREVIYINSGSLPVESSAYLETLAHELQHAIHWNQDPSEDTWVNEGLAELAVNVARGPRVSLGGPSRASTVSLVHWPLDHRNVSAHYRTASLFMHYLMDHHAGAEGTLRELVAEPADGVRGVEAYLANQGYSPTFRDVFRDWAVANLLDEPEGAYGYSNLEVQANISRVISQFSEVESQVPQYATEYLELSSLTGPVRLRFQGQAENTLLSATVKEPGCWWSNSGDSIASTLTRTVDLREVSDPMLRYRLWYNVEEDWDYGYVQVSTDGGTTWEALETPLTSQDNPVGNSFGPGYTGNSDGWLEEEIDLSPYQGGEVMVRFQYVTDDAINGAGLCFRDIETPGAESGAGAGEWEADGFVFTNNRIVQDYTVQLIEMGEENRVSTLSLDETNAGELSIPDLQKSERVVIAISALAPRTLQPASYTLAVEPAASEDGP